MIYGIRLLGLLRAHSIETHLILSDAAKKNVLIETGFTVEEVENMAGLGAVILPPVPAFYCAPASLDDIVDHTVGKILDVLDIDHDLFRRWDGAGPLREDL